MKTLFWQGYPKLETQLNITRNLIDNELQILVDREYDGLYETVTKLAIGSGKLLRPALVYLFNDLGPSPKSNEELVQIAGAMEILHFATLVHDDVIDDAALRRHETTVHQKFGKRQAIYTGDFLFTIFFDLLIRGLNDVNLLQKNAEQMKNVLLGELDQMKGNWNFDFTVAEYLNEVRGKTAALFGISALDGISLADGSEAQKEAAYEFGINLGIAFQMADDLLDFGETKKTGKPNFEDLNNGVFTLPVILALQNDDGKLKEILDLHDQNNDAKILKLIKERDGIVETKKLLHEYLNRAEANLEIFDKCNQKDILNKLVNKISEQVKK